MYASLYALDDSGRRWASTSQSNAEAIQFDAIHGSQFFTRRPPKPIQPQSSRASNGVRMRQSFSAVTRDGISGDVSHADRDGQSLPCIAFARAWTAPTLRAR